MLTEMLVHHCAPALAGLKTANMFSCKYRDEKELYKQLAALNRVLLSKGLRVIPLRCRNGKALIYLYRPERLLRDLQDQTAIKLLSERGYSLKTPGCCINHLMKRLASSEDFPHEIGLFLGYPPEDVCGFINEPGGCKLAGFWKVYGDAEAARKKFEKFRRCTDLYSAQLENGRSLGSLAVAENK